MESQQDLVSLRETVVQAGLELLDRHGLSLMFGSITYAKVFEYLWTEYGVRVTRGSVHERIWASQEDFRQDVLAESVRFFPVSHMSRALLARAIAADTPDQFARDVGSRTFPKVLASQTFAQFQSVKALSSRLDDPLATEIIHELLENRAQHSLAICRTDFPALIAALGLRPKASTGLTVDQTSDLFLVLMTALTEGGHLNHHAGAADIAAPNPFMSRSADSEDPWRIISIGIKCFLDFLLEPSDHPILEAEPPDFPWPQQYPDVKTIAGPWQTQPSRRPRDELKKLVLTAGTELLLKNGLELRPELLGYAQVFAHVKQTRGLTVRRASVHGRFWSSNDDYRLEVLTRSLEPNRRPVYLNADVLRGMHPVQAANGSIDLQQTKKEFIRALAVTLSVVSPDSVARRRLLQIKSALIDQEDSPNRSRLRAAVRGVDNERARHNKAEIQENLLDLGFRVRPSTGLSEGQALDLLIVLAMTTVAGITLNVLAGVKATTQAILLPGSGKGGPPTSWTPVGIAVCSYFDQLYE